MEADTDVSAVCSAFSDYVAEICGETGSIVSLNRAINVDMDRIHFKVSGLTFQ